jgi:DinB superfamily
MKGRYSAGCAVRCPRVASGGRSHIRRRFLLATGGDDLIDLTAGDHQRVKATSQAIETHLATLRRTPLLIGAIAEHLLEEQLRARPRPNDWSLVELLAHLHACAEVWSDDIERMLALDAPSFKKPHPRQLMRRHQVPTFAESARAFAHLREQLLARLQPLGSDQWERSSTINGRRHTVYTQTRRMALHEVAHDDQIRETCRLIAGPQAASSLAAVPQGTQ